MAARIQPIVYSYALDNNLLFVITVSYFNLYRNSEANNRDKVEF